MRTVGSRAEFEAARASSSGTVALVPTMGALHAGHTALLEVAREVAGSVVATIFVNPLQFGPSEDLATYPRTLDADLQICADAGADIVWTPAADDVYPRGAGVVRVDPGPLGEQLEGASRPGHFAGVLTVVAKFLNVVDPEFALFGQKDYQQFCLVEQMVGDLDFAVALVPVPTVREPDGLAMSSRNRYLSPTERRQAVVLSRALLAAQQAGRHGGDAVLSVARSVLDTEPDVALDYLELRGDDLGPLPEHGTARLLVAARVGTTRLIDNVEVML